MTRSVRPHGQYERHACVFFAGPSQRFMYSSTTACSSVSIVRMSGSSSGKGRPFTRAANRMAATNRRVGARTRRSKENCKSTEVSVIARADLLLLVTAVLVSAPSAGMIDWPQSTYEAEGIPRQSPGFVFQEPPLLPWRTVAGNVHLPLMLLSEGAALLWPSNRHKWP